MILSKDRAIALEAFALDDRKDNNKSSSLKICVNKEMGDLICSFEMYFFLSYKICR